MTISSDHTEIQAFVVQHNPSKSRVFALVMDTDQPVKAVAVEAVATASEPDRADELCAALNQYLYERENARGFQARLRAALAGEPASVSAAVDQTLARIKKFSTMHASALVKAVSPFGSFPLSACPASGCPACGECLNSCKNCMICEEGGAGEMLCECDVLMPPRTASLIHAVAELYSDIIHDLADEVPVAAPKRTHTDLWPVPPVAHRQCKHFYRQFARAFEDIARDITNCESPQPHNMAEEIALHIVLDHAAEIVEENSDEFELWTKGLPESPFDFDFYLLHSCLFQDKDYEGYLGQGMAAKPGELEEWFEDFNFPESRDSTRGFRR